MIVAGGSLKTLFEAFAFEKMEVEEGGELDFLARLAGGMLIGWAGGLSILKWFREHPLRLTTEPQPRQDEVGPE